MLTLYHGDTAVCAAKVRVTLAEKQLAFEGILLDLQKGDQFKPEYRKLNANAVVPTLLHDGAVITESTVINEYLDEVFPAPALRPAAAVDRARMRLWTKREDAIHDGINTMTTAIIFRVADLKKAMLFRDMEAALARGPWLLGADFSLADVGFMSFFYRLELMQTGGMWRDHFPRVTDWFERCKQRPSFATAIADFIGGEKIAQYRAIGLPLAPLVDVEFRKALQMI